MFSDIFSYEPYISRYGHRSDFTWLVRVNGWLIGVVQWSCQVGSLALTTKILNCCGFNLLHLFEKQNLKAKSPNIRLIFGAVSFWATPSL